MKPDRNDPVFLAWCAGFIDGEGSIGVYTAHGPKHYWYKGEKRARKTISPDGLKLQVTVYQNFIGPLAMIREVFGGTLFYRGSTRVWFLVMAGKRAAMLLEALLPYFVVKREEAECGIAFQEIRSGGRAARQNDQDALATKLRLLKHRGNNGKPEAAS